jgi:hypothetical protein
MNVLIVGSMQPWHESLLISRVPLATTHTVDYNRVTFQHDRMLTFTVAEWTRAFLSDSLPAYDMALAILSVEHDGLGRYGDPVLSDGDLQLMRRMHCALRPGGRLMLAVALGAQDVIAWNLRRVYGYFLAAHLRHEYSNSVFLLYLQADTASAASQLATRWLDRTRSIWIQRRSNVAKSQFQTNLRACDCVREGCLQR